MTNTRKTLANKVIFAVVAIFLTLNLIIFTGITLLNKNIFYDIEREKAQLIAKNYAPFLSMSIYLGLEQRVNDLVEQILDNTSVVEVKIEYQDKKHINKSKEYKHKTIKVSQDLIDPNSKKSIGRLEIYYSTHHYQEFLNRYFIVLIISFVFVIVTFFALYRYIQKLLQPLRSLAILLKDFSPDKRLDISYQNSDDEIALISNAIAASNKKALEYSRNLKEMTNTVINVNKNLEKKVKEELVQIREKDKQLFQQSKLAQMGEMINMIAHQWRQPLSAISSTTNDLLFKSMMDNIDKVYFEEELKNLQQYSQHLSKTIDDFRNFYKEDKSKQSIKVSNIVKDTLNIVKHSIESSSIELKTKLICDTKIDTYANELKQVILNLIKNAQEAHIDNHTKNPYIEIETNCDDNKVKITVSDNAGGIKEDILPKIFQPYFSTKLKKNGTGIGLYMSKTIVEEHCDGKLFAKNTQNGVTFNIILPLRGGEL